MKLHLTNTRDPIDFPQSENSMNERIRELAEQAGQGEPFHIPPEFVNRFAELIVRECCRIVLESSIPGSNNERDFVVTVREIKQHFGFES